MVTPKVQLYIRAALPDGSRQYLKPVKLANGALKNGWAILDGKPRQFADFTYYLRYLRDGRRVWESVGDDASLATIARRRTELRLSAAAEGMVLPGQRTESRQTDEIVSSSGRLLQDAIDEYLAEIKQHKSEKTRACYTLTLRLFVESLGRKADSLSIERVNREHALEFVTFLRDRGVSPRTVRNRIDFLQGFLHHFGLPSVLVGKDKPKYTQKKARAYNTRELHLMLDHATVDEADLLHFLLGTGARDQEARFACWSDLDLVAKTHTITEHRDLGFTIKDREEGILQLPDALVERLRLRRQRYPKDRLIFPTESGRPNGHLLRMIKQLALRAGINCGQCIAKNGQSCAEHPICRHIFLHKMRKTYATTLHRQGISARTIQGYLRHSSLETTLKYLADGEDEHTLGRINAAFDVMVGGAA